jgi:hypothetical protein
MPTVIVIETVGARPASDPAERTRHESPAGIRVSAASYPTRRPGVATPLIVLVEGAVDMHHHHHSRRSQDRTCLLLQLAGRITVMHLSQAAPMEGMIPTTHMLLTREIPVHRMTERASRAVRYVVEATPTSPVDMTREIREIRVHRGSRRCVLPVRLTTIGVNRD